MNSKLNILLSFDNNYIDNSIVLLKSIEKYNPQNNINVYVFYDNLSSINRVKCIIATCFTNIKIKFIKVPKKIQLIFKMSKDSVMPRITYYRLLASKLLPKNIDKVLYLDCDTLVVNNLNTLYKTDIENYAVAAVEGFCPDSRREKLNISSSKKYFNTGVLLINLNYWRKYNVWKKYCEIISEFNEKLERWAQDVINISFEKEIYPLDFSYNTQQGLLKDNECLEKINIIHFTGSGIAKPWYSDSTSCFKNRYDELLNLTNFTSKKTKCFKESKKSNSLKSTQAYYCYSKILPYVKPYWFRTVLAMLICIPIGSLDAVIALSLKPYMDLVMVEKSIQSPWYIPLGIVAFTSLQGMLNYLATYLNTWVGGKITNDLKFALYSKFLTFETAYFDKKKSGDIVYRFNTDADTACNGLLENMKVFLSRLFSSISLVGVLFYNSWQLAIIASIVLGCAFAPIANLRKRVKSVMDQSVTAGSAVITAYNESFAGNKTIISYNLEDRQKLNMKTILNNIFSLKIKMIQRTSWLSPLMHVIVSIGIGVAIGYGSHLILTKQITSGNFVSFITALILLYTPIKNLGNNFNSVQFSFMAIERIFNILDSKPKIVNKANAVTLKFVQQNIKFKDVCFEYIKNKPVLKNINLTADKGETIAFVGNSGGGKSTIVSLIPRFYDVTSGVITIDEKDIRDYTLESLRQNIAVVFQDNFLFSGTIRENILLGNENATQEQLQKAVEMAYLSDFIVDLKDGLDTQIGERGIRLSGGQKQRVAIARAFLKDAPIVVLDEATSALDNKAEAIVQKAIENLMQDKTVFVIAHRLSTIQNADKIVVINQGEIVEIGTHEQLLNVENGAYKALYEMQFKQQEDKDKYNQWQN